MRYDEGHKDRARQRIVEAAAARFRRDGLGSVGLAKLMGDAGLTHGAFYGHFRSKDALVQAVLRETKADLRQSTASEGEPGLRGIVNRYLSKHHRDHPEVGCPAAALSPEIGRASRGIQRAYTEQLRGILGRIEAALPRPDRQTAQVVFAVMLGSLQMARATDDEALSDQMLESGKKAALQLAGVAAGERHHGDA